jgi:hypothetical protein
MEHKLGETFTWNGHTLEVAEVEDPEFACTGCWFFEHAIPCYEKDLRCMDDSRRDHTNVIFKNSTKTEEL